MTNDEILAGMIMAAKAEREAGFPGGWAQPPESIFPQCDELVDAGLAEKHKDANGYWYRPTREGERTCKIQISRVS